MSVAHQPVMVDEVIRYLITAPDGIYVDGTAGTGGHSLDICKTLGTHGRLICLDVDKTSLRLAEKRLVSCKEKVTVIKESYVNLDVVLKEIGVGTVNGILLDLGLSSYQLESSGRGFSFLREEPLDMRMDEDRGIAAGELVNTISVEGLQRLLWGYAQERWAKSIARAIAEERKKKPLTSTLQLTSLVEAVIPARYHSRKRHPATKTFQALRIAVNNELDNISDFLKKVPYLLVTGGRLVVISYHSLEDRIVKHALYPRQNSDVHPRGLPVIPEDRTSLMRPVRKKGLRPSKDEVNTNPRSRSAIMRIGERK